MKGKKPFKVDFTRQNLKKPNLNNTTYNFVPKNAMELRFDKSFAFAFSKANRCGRSPRSFWVLGINLQNRLILFV